MLNEALSHGSTHVWAMNSMWEPWIQCMHSWWAHVWWFLGTTVQERMHESWIQCGSHEFDVCAHGKWCKTHTWKPRELAIKYESKCPYCMPRLNILVLIDEKSHRTVISRFFWCIDPTILNELIPQGSALKEPWIQCRSHGFNVGAMDSMWEPWFLGTTVQERIQESWIQCTSAC